jgi:chromosome partitioning protein
VLTVAFFNFAGGCGKSSLTRDCGTSLAARGYRVLLVDLDPQHSLTYWLGIDDDTVALNDTAYPVLESSRGNLPAFRHAFGVDVLPSTHALSRAEPALIAADFGVLRLRTALQTVSDRYDFCLVDSPPSLGKLVASAISASDLVVVPVLTQSKGVENLPAVLEIVEEWQRGVPSLRIGGFVPVMVENTTHSKNYLKLIQEQLPAHAPVFPPVTRRPAVYQIAQHDRIPIPHLRGSEFDAARGDVEAVTNALLRELGVRS